MAGENHDAAKKVLFCASAASHIINFHNRYFDCLAEMGFEVHAATGINAADNSDAALVRAKKTHTLAFEKGKNFALNIVTVFKLAGIIRREGYDIVSTHAMLAGLVGRLAAMLARSKKTKIIHTCHGYLFDDDGSFKTKLKLLIEKFLSRRTDMLFVMNSDDLHIAKKYRLCKNIEHIEGMGVGVWSVECGVWSESEIAKKYGIPEGRKYFLCIGEFSKRKSQQHIIRAFGRFLHGLPESRCAVQLVFLGDGVLLKKCRKLCETLGIADHVTFCGYVGETPAFYRAFAHCVVSASRFEGLPFNVMEALHFGVPVIASNVKGHKDLISDGVNGYLYEYGDEARLSGLFEKVLDSAPFGVGLDEKYRFDSVKGKILDSYARLTSPQTSR